MNTWIKRLIILTLVATLLVPTGCGSREAIPTPIPTLAQKAPSTATPQPTSEPTPTPLPPTAPRLLDQTPDVGEELTPGEAMVFVFDQPMDAESVEGAFSVNPSLEGRLEWVDAATLRFEPDADALIPEGRYTFTIDTSARSQQQLPLRREIVFRQRVAGHLEVAGVFPADGNTQVAPDDHLIVTFNRPVVPLVDIDSQAGLLDPLEISHAIQGHGSWTNTSIYSFVPASPLAAGETYTITVPAELASISGATLQEDYIWSFTVQPPDVTLVTPLPEQTLVDPATAIVLSFAQAMDRNTVSDRFEVVRQTDGEAVSGRKEWQGNLLRFVPESPLDRGASYEVRLTAGSRVESGDTSMVDDRIWSFSVAPLPAITYMTPSDGDTQIDLYSSMQIRFSAPMDPEITVSALEITPTVRTYSYWQKDDTELWVSWSLKPSAQYTVTLTQDARDRFGEQIDAPVSATFTTRPATPSISLLTEGPVGVYSAFGETQIPIRHVNVSRISMDLYSLSPEELVVLTREGGWPNWDRFAVRAESRVATWTLESDAPLNSEEIAYSALPEGADSPLSPGIYLLVARAPEASRPERHAFIVTPLNITLKTTGEEALVWVTDLEKGEPVAGAEIKLYDYDGGLASEGTTDRSGLVLLPMPDQERWESVTVIAETSRGVGAVVSNWTDGISPWDFDLAVAWESTSYRGHVLTDRRIYRPGQIVYYKAILRLDDDGMYSLPKTGTTVEASLVDSEGQTVWSDSAQLSAMGSLDGEIALADSATLGTYSLILRVGDDYIQQMFQVAEYRAPEFTVAVTSDKPEYISGDVMTVDTEATFFFGGPVSDASVQWRVWADPYYFDRWAGKGRYSFGEYDQYYDPGYTPADTGILTEGVGQTDADGHLTLEIPATLEGTRSRRFVVEVSVIDLNNQEVTGQVSAIVHAGALYIGMNTDRYVGTAREPMAVEIVTVDTQGAPVGNTEIEVSVAREEWYSVQKKSESGGYLWQNEVRETPVYSETIRTNAGGLGKLTWTPGEGGTYKVLARTRDEQGNEVRSTLYLWVSGRTFVNWGRDNNARIDLIADKESYLPGDVASILVPSPFQGPVTALLTIERGSIIEHRVIELASNSELIQVPIEPEYAPNVFVSLVLVSGIGGDDGEAGYRVGMVMLPVSTVGRELQLSIAPDKSGDYQPGDEASFLIRATDQAGNPVKAELTVQLVDLAIEMLIGGTPPDVLDTFYRQRGLAVNTALSLVRRHLPQEPTGDEGKGGGGGADGEGLRTEFPETALWEPSLSTDENGEAVVGVKLPDNLTTWRLTVQAATGDTLVGTGRADIISNLDIMVRPALPRFLVVGDAPRLGTVIHNNTDEGVEIRITAEAEGLELEETEQTIVLSAGARQDVYWPATVVATDGVTITFSAGSGTLHDAVRIALPVYHASAPEVVGTSGSVEDVETEVIRVPADADPEQGGLTVNLEPSLAAAIQEGLDYLEAYPYDCIEQTVSRFLPNLASYRALKALGIERPELEVPLSQQIAKAVQRIYALQNFEGGWGWWSGGESAPTLTAYVLYGLSQARAAGYVVDDNSIEQAISYLYRYLDESIAVTRDDYDSRATVLYALAEAGQGDLGRATALFEDRDNLSLFARAYLAMTLHILEPDEPSRVDVLVNEFVQAGIMSSTGLHWEEDTRTYWQMNTDTRTTAIVLRAITWTDPENSLLPQAVRWLTMARSSGRWESTQENVWAILALSDYMSSSGELEAAYSYQLSINGDVAAEGSVDETSLDVPRVVAMPMNVLTAGEDTYVDIEKAPADAPGRLYYSAFLQYLLPVQDIQPLDRGIIVYRQYLKDGESAETISSARVNDIITVKLTVVAPYDLYYLIVEDPFPAGCEAIDPTLATTRRMEPETMSLIPEGFDYGWLWYRSWPTHHEIHDEKLALFADHLPRGTYEYTYQLRCTTAGDYVVIPTQAYQMYEPDVFGREGGRIFTIAP